jgi:hypothetical protein
METQENQGSQNQKHEGSFSSGRAMAGGVLLIVGGIWLAEKMGADLPHWMFTWPMIPIAVGFFIGAKDSFRDFGWLVPVAVGVIFLLEQNVEGMSWATLWPVMIIVAGLCMMLNSGRKRRDRCR